LLVTASYTAKAAIDAAKAAAAIPATLDVKEIVANNLKTVKVVFNQAVDKDTVNNDNVKITDKGSNVTLSDDATTAYVVLDANVAQSTELEVKVNAVKTKDGKELKDFSKKVLAVDSTVPVATGAAFVNHKEVMIQFSEPMNFSKAYYEGLSNIKIDGATVIAKATPNFVKNTVTLTFPTLLKNGTLKLEVSDIRDFAGYNIAKAEFDVLVTEDKEAPVLVSAEVKNLTTIEAVFNERVDVLGSFKVNGTAVTSAVADATGTKITLNLGATLDLGAVVEIKVAYKGQKDVAGNEVKDEVTHSFKVADDTTLPTASLKIESGNKAVVTFSKSMLTNVGTIKVLDKDKKEIGTPIAVVAGLFKANTNNTVIELTGVQLGLDNNDPGDYFLNIKDMQDSTVRKNLLPEQTLEFKSLDTKAPVLAATYLAKAGTLTGADLGKDDTVTFYFNEAVDVDTAKNLANYIETSVPVGPLTQVSGAAFKSISADGKNVTLTVPQAAHQVGGSEFEFDVYAIKDVASNMMGVTSVTINTVNVLTLGVVDVVAKNKVEVNFGTAIATADPSAFVIYEGASIANQFISASVDGTKVTFITSSDLKAASATYSLVLTNKDALVDVYGNKLAAANLAEVKVAGTLVDKIKPTVKEAKRHATNLDEFVITFDEEVQTLVNGKVIVRDKDNALMAITTDYTLTLGTDTLTIKIVRGAGYNDVINVQLEVGAVTDKATTVNSNAFTSLTSSDKIVK